MAIYRQIHTSFWQDDFIIELNAQEKLFYIWLIANPKVNQSGCYEISRKVAELETGLNWKQKIEPMIEHFKSKNKIDFDFQTNEVLVKNWLKFNAIPSPKVYANIISNIQNIKNATFKKYCMDTLSILYQYPMDIRDKEKNKEKNKKKNKDKDKNKDKEKNKKSATLRVAPFSQTQQKFHQAFPEKAIDADFEEWQDIDKLIEKINDSDFLPTQNNLGLKWMKDNYARILKGDYDRRKKPTKSDNSGNFMEEYEDLAEVIHLNVKG